MRVFNAVPADKLDWRPEPKARTARELIGHLIGHEQDVVELLGSGEIHHRMQVAFDDVAQALELYEQAGREIGAALTAMTDAAWDDVPAKFLNEDTVIMEMPRRDLGWLMWFDCIHHVSHEARRQDAAAGSPGAARRAAVAHRSHERGGAGP